MPKNKICFIDSCPNNSKENSNKLFITVPIRPETRLKWYQAVKKKEEPTRSVHIFCCEDHFDLENDIVNWTYFKRFGTKMALKRNVVPHIFPEKINPESQYSDTERELKRKWLEKYEKECEQSNTTYLSSYTPKRITNYANYSIETSVIDKDKNIRVDLKSRGHHVSSQVLGNSSKHESENNVSTTNSVQNEIIIPSRLKVHIEPDLPQLIFIKNQRQIEKHKPLLLRRKSSVKTVSEVVWVNPPLVEVSNDILNLKQQELNKIFDDKLEIVKNERPILNESQLNLTKTELVDIKTEQIDIIDDIKLEEDNFSDSDSNSQEQITDIMDSRIPVEPEIIMEIKQEPDEEPEEPGDFEFVNMNVKSDPAFYYEDPLKISGTNIFVVNQSEESILS